MEARQNRPVGNDGPDAKSILQQSQEFRHLWLANTYHEVRSKTGRLKPNGLNDKQRKRMDDLEASLNGSAYYRAWCKAMAFGERDLTPDERRDLMMGLDPAGGWTVPPEQFLALLIRKIDDLQTTLKN